MPELDLHNWMKKVDERLETLEVFPKTLSEKLDQEKMRPKPDPDAFPLQEDMSMSFGEGMILLIGQLDGIEERLQNLEHACKRELDFVRCECKHRRCDHKDDKGFCRFGCGCKVFKAAEEQED